MFQQILVLVLCVVAGAHRGHGCRHKHHGHFGEENAGWDDKLPALQGLEKAFAYSSNCQAPLSAATKFFICESKPNADREFCSVSLAPFQEFTSFTLENSLETVACIEGQTYGVESSGVWVSQGCTATFRASFAVSEELCRRAREQLESNGLQEMVSDIKACQPDFQRFCDARAYQRGRPPHPPPPPGPEWLPMVSPMVFSLSHCIVDHAGDFSPQCQATDLVQVLQVPALLEEYGPLGALVLGATGGLLALACGLGYFLVQRRRLQQRRGVRSPKTGQWTTGLFTPDLRTFLPSCLCPCFQSALNQAEVHGRDSSLADVAVNCHSNSLWSNTYYTRQALRAQHDMPEEPMLDCLTALCCTPCAMAQHTRELDARPRHAAPNSQPEFPSVEKEGTDKLWV